MKRTKSMLPRGGKHQRLARAASPGCAILSDAGNSMPLHGDPEVDVLLELWSLGLMSALTLQVIASAACKVAPRPNMEALASIGAAGGAPGNAHRDLERKLNRGLLDDYIPRPWNIEVPMRDVKKRPPAVVPVGCPVMMPHEWLAAMWARSRSEFNDYILGGAGSSPAGFWEHVRAADPRLSCHPAKHVEPKRMLIPLRVHGDGVPVGKGKNAASMCCRSVRCCTRLGGLGRLGISWQGLCKRRKSTEVMTAQPWESSGVPCCGLSLRRSRARGHEQIGKALCSAMLTDQILRTALGSHFAAGTGLPCGKSAQTSTIVATIWACSILVLGAHVFAAHATVQISLGLI